MTRVDHSITVVAEVPVVQDLVVDQEMVVLVILVARGHRTMETTECREETTSMSLTGQVTRR